MFEALGITKQLCILQIVLLLCGVIKLAPIISPILHIYFEWNKNHMIAKDQLVCHTISHPMSSMEIDCMITEASSTILHCFYIQFCKLEWKATQIQHGAIHV